MFHALGLTIHTYRRPTLIVAALAVVASIAMLLHGGALTTGSIRGLESGRAQALVDHVRGFPMATTFAVVFQSDTLDPDDADFQSAMQAALAPLRADRRVEAITTADDAPPAVGLLMTNGVERAALAWVTVRGEFREARENYPEIRESLRSDSLTITCTGQLPYVQDLDETLEHDLLFAELVSLPLALFILVLVFRTVLAALLPVVVGACSVLGAIAIVLGLSHVMDLAQYTVNVCSLIGLGVSIDYSLFIVSRYREELAKTDDRREALARAVDGAGRVVVFSGVAVGSGLAGLVSFRASYLEAIGIGGAIVVVLAVVAALTVLPALLAVLGPRIAPARPRETSDVWPRIVGFVTRAPLRVLLPTLAGLVLMGLPFRHLELAAADVRVLPADVEARRGYELMRRAFSDIASTRVEVAIQFPSQPVLTKARAGAIFDLVERIRDLPHVTRVESIVAPVIEGTREAAERELLDPQPMLATAIDALKTILVRDDVVVVYAITDQAPDSDHARAIVREIRQLRQVADGELLVGGQIANDVDTTDFIVGHSPRAVAIVVGSTVVALFLLLGSVLLPLKALVMNLLSITGSFGALVWVFQDGNLWVTEGRPIEPTLPVLLFCTLFGLSMDYEVLMLSRIKEAYEQHGDSRRAVAEGLQRTGGLITSAAAIMIAVFAAFSLGRIIFIQAVGFGMALAVALDATLVRVLLVPATMQLFGDLNWWMPRWLAALRAKLGFERLRHD